MQLGFHKAVALPTLLHGSKSGIIKAEDISRIQSVEVRGLRIIEDCTRLNHIKNGDIRKELKMESVQSKIG
jgi:hypothetical protein